MVERNAQPVAVADLTWPEFADRIAALAPVILPVGALEQHGLHLPLDTDTEIAAQFAVRLAVRVNGLVLPALSYGARSLARSGGGSRFPGTVNLSGAMLSHLVAEIVGEQARHGVTRIIVLLGHGENDPFAIEGAEMVLANAAAGGVRILVIGWWQVLTAADVDPLFPEGFPGWDREHAARVETALMLALAPERVRLAALGAIDAIVATPYIVLPTPENAVPSQGSLADPRGATAEAGQELVDTIVSRLAETVTTTFGLLSEGGAGDTAF